jgi:acyl carrier protein
MFKVESLGRDCDESAFNASAEAAKETLSVDAIKSWLISEIVDARDLAVEEPFANYGLSSMTGVMLSGNIEGWLGIRLDPAVAWDYPTIESLAAHLAEEVKSQKPSLRHM